MALSLGNIKIYIMDNYEQMSEKGAEFICQLMNEKPSGVLGLATGSTPIGMYQALIARYKENKLDFSGITTFNLDEYYPILKSNEQSYDYFMKDNLFNHINIDQNNIHIPNGEAADITAECAAYEEKIKAVGGIDLQVLGMGLNGHIGFNEPDEALNAGTSVIQLDASTIDANSRFFESRDEVPKLAVSMGMKTIMMAKKILLLVNGEKKSKILKEALTGKITTAIPASLLQLHPDVAVVLDKEAAQYFL